MFPIITAAAGIYLTASYAYRKINPPKPIVVPRAANEEQLRQLGKVLVAIGHNMY